MEELKYKVNDEVLIKGTVVDVGDPKETSYPYRIRLDGDDMSVSWSAWFTKSSVVGMASDLVRVEDQKTYEQGLNDAWEMVKKITIGLELCKLQTIYDGFDTMSAIVQRYSAQEAIDKYNAWKERNEFKMGDIVEYDIYAGLDTSEIHRAIFYSETKDDYWVLRDQCLTPQKLTKEEFKLRKVGESGLDIAGALAKIRDEED